MLHKSSYKIYLTLNGININILTSKKITINQFYLVIKNNFLL